MTMRNESPARAFLRLKAVKRSIDRTGHGASFDYFILSGLSNPEIVAAEEAEAEAWRWEAGDSGRVVYRRRDTTPATRPETCATSASAGGRITI